MLFLSANDLPRAGVSFLYVVTMTHGAVEGTDMMSNEFEMMRLERLKLVQTIQSYAFPRSLHYKMPTEPNDHIKVSKDESQGDL